MDYDKIAADLEHYVPLGDAPDWIKGKRDAMYAGADAIRELVKENTGLTKARDLLLKGMESQSELMDGLKQQTRAQAAEIEELRRLLEIELFRPRE